MRSRLRTAALIAAVPLALGLLAGCTPVVAMTPAAHATDPTCADVIVALPQTAGGAAQRETDAQATSAWGNPTSVLLRCGVTPPGPTSAHCFSVAGIDWVLDDSHKPTYIYTTFGRTPAVQVTVDTDLKVATDGVLGDLGNAIGAIKQSTKAKCTTIFDSSGGTGASTG